MRKRDLIRRSARKSTLTQAQVGEAVNLFLDELCTALASDVDHIELRNFLVFDVVKRKARTGKLPNGQPCHFPERGRVKVSLNRRYQQWLDSRVRGFAA